MPPGGDSEPSRVLHSRRRLTLPGRTPKLVRAGGVRMATGRAMRKFLNDPERVVSESLAGLAAAHPDLLRFNALAQVVVRVDAPRLGKVALISGGGSGHEPLHAGFVGIGML